jgi:O-acetyl-ADP-ribose deacetylase (regulator of RNase III)
VPTISVVLGDITRERVDAIVNAANEHLVAGGGVDGAIHRASGEASLSAACAKLGGCSVGDAKVTPGFALPARYIFHAVGPRWSGGDRGEPELLASCYRRCLALADELEVKSLAFPAISTGAIKPLESPSRPFARHRRRYPRSTWSPSMPTRETCISASSTRREFLKVELFTADGEDGLVVKRSSSVDVAAPWTDATG